MTNKAVSFEFTKHFKNLVKVCPEHGGGIPDYDALQYRCSNSSCNALLGEKGRSVKLKRGVKNN